MVVVKDISQRFFSFFQRQTAVKTAPAATSGGGYGRKLSLLVKLECGPMPNLMVALPNIGGALCPTPQSLADARY